MVTCNECQNVLVDYVDGHLSDGERQRLGAHLAGCAACRAQFASECRLSGMLQGALAAAPREQVLGLVGWDKLALASAGPPRPTWWAGARRLAVSTLCAATHARGALVAVGLAALGIVAVCWHQEPGPAGETIAAHSSGLAAVNGRQFADLEVEIEREANAAQLAMSAELLAEGSSADEYVRQEMRFVGEAFPDTKAGREAALRIQNHQRENEAL